MFWSEPTQFYFILFIYQNKSLPDCACVLVYFNSCLVCSKHKCKYRSTHLQYCCWNNMNIIMACNEAFLLEYVCFWVHNTMSYSVTEELTYPRSVSSAFNLEVIVPLRKRSGNLSVWLVTLLPHRVTSNGFEVKIIPSSPYCEKSCRILLRSPHLENKGPKCTYSNRCPSLVHLSDRLQDTWWFRPELISGWNYEIVNASARRIMKSSVFKSL